MASSFTTWQNAIMNALVRIGNDIVGLLPDLIAAVLVLFIGLFLANLLSGLVKKIIKFTKLDEFLQNTVGLGKLKEQGIDFCASGLVSWVVKWFFIIVTFIAVADILNWSQLTKFLESIALYLPNVIITVLILLAGFILGGGLRDLIVRAVQASSLPASAAGLIGTVARWAVIIFAIMASLTQLGIASDLVKILFTGFVGMLALAGGLSFGLGGRDKASAWLEKLQRDIKH
jgi:hypothetical protein